MYVWRNNDAPSRYHFCKGRTVSITYSECVFVALVIQHSMRMRLIILSSVNCLALQYFSSLRHIRRDFRGGGRGNFEYEKCVLIFCTSFFHNISHSRPNYAKCVYRSSCKVPVIVLLYYCIIVFLYYFNETKLFSTYFRKILKYHISWKFGPTEAKLFHADGQTWRNW